MLQLHQQRNKLNQTWPCPGVALGLALAAFQGRRLPWRDPVGCITIAALVLAAGSTAATFLI